VKSTSRETRFRATRCVSGGRGAQPEGGALRDEDRSVVAQADGRRDDDDAGPAVFRDQLREHNVEEGARVLFHFLSIEQAVFYSTSIFESAGLDDGAAQLATLGMGAVNVLMTFVRLTGGRLGLPVSHDRRFILVSFQLGARGEGRSEDPDAGRPDDHARLDLGSPR
jgi:hypothetical protein